MTTQQVTDRLEATSMPDGSRETKGMAAVAGKSAWWVSQHEIHSAAVEGPLAAGAHFCVRFIYDVTNKPSGRRMTLDELGVYEVRNGRIVREEFFYSMGG